MKSGLGTNCYSFETKIRYEFDFILFINMFTTTTSELVRVLYGSYYNKQTNNAL